MSVLDDICAYADERLAGSGLTFAVVAWLKGREADASAVALSAQPPHQKSAPTTLRTAAAAWDAAQPATAATPIAGTEGEAS